MLHITRRYIYIKTFERMPKAHENYKKYNWRTGQDVYDWWIGSDDKKEGDC